MAFSLVAICCGKSSAHHGLRTPDALQAACCLQGIGAASDPLSSAQGSFLSIGGIVIRSDREQPHELAITVCCGPA